MPLLSFNVYKYLPSFAPIMESSDDGSRLSAEHTNTLITIERTGAAMSMAAITVTVVSYAVFRRLRTTPNLFLFFASIANAGASVAAMMGYDGLRMGVNSSLCQTQGLLFEWCVFPLHECRIHC